MDARQWLALGLLAATIAAVLVRPRRPGEGVVALAGAGIAILTGLIAPDDAARALLRDLDVIAFFVGLMLLAQGAEDAGLFRWLALRIVRSAGGDPGRLMVNIILAGIVITAFFSNDAAVLLLTPSVLAATSHDGVDPLPFALACTFIADTASSILPISNPVNLLALSRLDISPEQYVSRLALPGLAAAAVTLLLFLLLYRGHLRRVPALAMSSSEPDTPAILRGCAALALLSQAGLYALFALQGWPLGYVTLGVGVGLVLLLSCWRRSWRSTAGAVSWQALALVVGLLLVVHALDATGVTSLAAVRLARLDALGPVGSLLVMGGLVALAANLINNWPAMLLTVSALGTGSFGPQTDSAAFGAILGAGIGPKLTLIGSLATVLWLALLRQHEVDLPMRRYMALTLVVTPLALASALLVAALLVWGA